VWVPLGTTDVARIDPTTNTVVATVAVDPGAGWTAYDETSVWVASGTSRTVSRIDAATNKVVATTPIDAKPLDGDVVNGTVWFPGDDGRLYPLDPADNSVGPAVVSSVNNPFVIAGMDGEVWAVDYVGTDVVRIDPSLAVPTPD
jgi:YVTN family beta-propeller protein